MRSVERVIVATVVYLVSLDMQCDFELHFYFLDCWAVPRWN